MHKVTNFEIALFIIFLGCVVYAIFKLVSPKIELAIQKEQRKLLEMEQKIKSLSEELLALENQEPETFEFNKEELHQQHEKDLYNISVTTKASLENMKQGVERELQHKIIDEITERVMAQLDYEQIFTESLTNFKQRFSKR